MNHKLKLYIEKVESEIEEHIDEEIGFGKLIPENEHDLHLLFENRKHAKEWLCELDGDAHHAASSSASR